MEFKFDASQEHQLQAIDAVVGLFEGQPRIEAGFQLAMGDIPAVANQLDLTESALLENLQKVQAENGLPPDAALLPTVQTITGVAGPTEIAYHNFSVEMETGTGKTYVYIRTALELYRSYGFRKFIIVVPSIAIREGVIKTFQVTEKHFRQLYGNQPYRYYEYDSDNLTQVRRFALSDSVEFMVMTIDAFNKDDNRINRSTDNLNGETPIFLVQAARPILILDEPQTKMEGEKNILALGELHPLMTLRYSATHNNPFNRLFRLTPFEAYRRNLVKRVEVASVTQEDDANRAAIEVVDISSTARSMQATLRVMKLHKSGVKQVALKVKPGDDLFSKTDLPEYQGYVVDLIQDSGVVFAASGREIEVRKGQAVGDNKHEIFEAQIATAIEEHFRKQRRMKALGIKVLTLFFIDRVANYAGESGETGVLRALFDSSFNRLKNQFSEWSGFQPEQVQAAYFAKKTSGEWEESSTGTAKKDKEAYDLIMRDKERLLSFEEPVAFIFSHSALNEGWDNPNIFQICALRDVKSPMARRQQIGRGVRLAVNQQGDRVSSEQVNVLTVIASETYTQFVETYQQEIEAVYGIEGSAPKPSNSRDKVNLTIQKQHYLSEDFRMLWDRIRHKTRYSVNIETDDVIREAVQALKTAEIRPPRVTMVKASVRIGESGDFEAVQSSAVRDVLRIQAESSLPDLIERVSYLLSFHSTPVSLSRKTLYRILVDSRRLSDGIANPHEFAAVTTAIIRDVLAEQLVRGIQYERIDDWYEMTQFEAENLGDWKEYLVPATKSVYDYVRFDSSIESEFVKAMEARDDIRLYVKLPDWFKVSTPVGNYNPDWAIVMDDPTQPDSERLYLVRETKGEGELRPTEKRKTECGEKHFKQGLGVDYRIVTTASELP